MGIFGNKYRTYVGTSVTRVLDDEKLPETLKTSVLTAILSNGNVVDNILDGMLTCLGANAQKMYNYAEDHYGYGLPSHTVLSSKVGTSQLTSVLQSVVGAGTTLVYNQFGPMNNLHAAWISLVNTHGYDSSTNQLGVLTISKGTPVYLKDMVIKITGGNATQAANGSLSQWGTPPNAGYTPERASFTNIQTNHSPIEIGGSTSSDYALVTYVWETSTTTVIAGVSVVTKTLNESSFTIAFSGYDSSDYFQVKYFYAGKNGYWAYKYGSGTYPTLDAVFTTAHSAGGTYFPFTYFRYNKVSMGSSPTSAEYLASKKMVKYLGMDYEEIIDQVHENPSINDVEQALMMMAVPAETDNEMEQRYLFDYFNRLADEVEDEGVSPTYDLGTIVADENIYNNKPRVSVVIQDTRMKMTLSCLGISNQTRAGVKGTKGQYFSGVETLNVTKIVKDAGTGGEVTWTVPVSRHYYHHQITDSSYEEVQVFGLIMTYQIQGQFMTVGDAGDDILLVPVDVSLCEEYPILEREELYARGLHYVFNSLVSVKVKWYETGLFKAFVVLVMAIIVIYTYGAAIEAYVATLSAMTPSALLITVATGLLTFVATSVGVKMFVKAVGPKVAIVIAIIAAVAGMYMFIDADSIAGAPWASDLLSLASNLTSNISSVMVSGVQIEANEFSMFAEAKTTALEEANKLLNTSIALNPFVIFGESPDDFYNRTVHSGNAGIIGIDAISSYVDAALTLPKLSTTIQGGF